MSTLIQSPPSAPHTRVDPTLAKQWGGGDRCPFANAGPSRLTTIPADHPPIPFISQGTQGSAASSPSSPPSHSHSHSHDRHSDDPLDPTHVEAHHHLPTASDPIPADPILYLPPLLSPLPEHARHSHKHSGPTEEELSSFSTRLPDIDPASLALHQALHHFAPIDSFYASREYSSAFNWSSLELDDKVEREWYCVVFRSRRNKESESLSLYQADREAHEEAVKNGGLILYWYGVPDSTGLNLATCIWQSRRHAIKAISGPKHLQAMKHAQDAYEVYDLERWVLKKEKGTKGFKLHKWQGGEVGW